MLLLLLPLLLLLLPLILLRLLLLRLLLLIIIINHGLHVVRGACSGEPHPVELFVLPEALPHGVHQAGHVHHGVVRRAQVVGAEADVLVLLLLVLALVLILVLALLVLVVALVFVLLLVLQLLVVSVPDLLYYNTIYDNI